MLSPHAVCPMKHYNLSNYKDMKNFVQISTILVLIYKLKGNFDIIMTNSD